MGSLGKIILLWLAGVGAALQFAKLSMALEIATAEFHLGPTAQGFAVSAVGAVGIAFALTAGSLVGHIGALRAVQVGLGLGAGLSIMSVLPLAPLGFIALRAVEGVSHLLIVVGAPVLIIALASRRRQSVAMGLWGTFFGSAFFLAGFAGPPILAHTGWAGLMFAHACWMGLLLMAITIAISPRNIASSAKVTNFSIDEWVEMHRSVYQRVSTALPGLLFGCHTLTFVALLTYVPRYVADIETAPDTALATIGTILPLASLLAALFAGWLIQWSNRPFLILAFCFSLKAISLLILFTIEMTYYQAFALSTLTLTLSGMVQGGVFASLPMLAKSTDELAGANASIAQMGNLGAFLGPPIFATLLADSGWIAAALFILICSLSGATLALTVPAWKRSRQKGG